MFGYVKPQSSELLVKEYEFYKATYCGICRAMKKHTGVFSNVTLSYDSVFLALVRMLYIADEPIEVEPHRCIAHPFSRRPMLKENSAIVYTARAFALLAYHKLDDDAYDERYIKKLAAKMTKPLVSSALRSPDTTRLSELASEKLRAIRALERDGCPSPDEPANLFGELLGAIFCEGLSGNAATLTYECGYHLGRFIYCADAAEDFERDRERGSYNPYVIFYGGVLTEESRSQIARALRLECSMLERAIELLPFEKSRAIENIIKNIIYLGLIKRISFLDKPSCKENEK